VNRNIAFGTGLCLLLLLGFSFSTASAQTVIISYSNRGNYDGMFGDYFPGSTNYIVGYDVPEYRNFFVFDLSGVVQPIASATLDLYLPNTSGKGYFSSHPSENFQLHDVVTSISNLTAGTGGLAAFNDLGSGVVYGNRSISDADEGTVVEILLNTSAVASMNANHGLFAMGGSLTTLDHPPTFIEVAFAFTGNDSDVSELRLTFVPEASTATLIAFAAMIFGMRSRKRST
jgi:hypothetical protein